MQNIFIKKISEEQGLTFFIHFMDGNAVRQVELGDGGAVYLTTDDPVKGDAMLCDQGLEWLEYSDCDLISEQEFNDAWGGADQSRGNFY
jgi:hypothetical protein